ncbi:MAG: hypothetical protein AAGG75_14325 [Bacteroidota bacterium]
MNKLSIAWLAVLLCSTLGQAAAQDFTSAPARGVKTVVEWIQRNGDKGVQKGYVYRFHPKGHITSFSNDALGESCTFEYDRQFRLKAKQYNFGANGSTTIYQYKSQFHSVEEEYKGGFAKSLLFFDQRRRLIEKKSFTKGDHTNNQYQLFERYVYHYDNRDSLLGEMYYNYADEQDTRSPYSRKILHRYHPNTGRKTNITEFGYNRLWQISTDFDYYDNGRLRKKTIAYRDGRQQVVIYEYKDGQLWQERSVESVATVTKVYKSGRLIRKRINWKNGDSELIDYQYEFY